MFEGYNSFNLYKVIKSIEQIRRDWKAYIRAFKNTVQSKFIPAKPSKGKKQYRYKNIRNSLPRNYKRENR